MSVVYVMGVNPIVTGKQPFKLAGQFRDSSFPGTLKSSVCNFGGCGPETLQEGRE